MHMPHAHRESCPAVRSYGIFAEDGGTGGKINLVVENGRTIHVFFQSLSNICAGELHDRYRSGRVVTDAVAHRFYWPVTCYNRPLTYPLRKKWGI